jgi:hypothetical protein
MVLHQSDVEHDKESYPRNRYVYDPSLEVASAESAIEHAPQQLERGSPTGESLYFLGGRKDAKQSYCMGMQL